MPGYALLRRPRSGRFCAFCDPFFRCSGVPPFRRSAVPPFRCSGVPPFRIFGRSSFSGFQGDRLLSNVSDFFVFCCNTSSFTQ